MPHSVALGQAWAANTVNTAIYRHHGLLSVGAYQFCAFYADPQRLRIVRRDLASGHVSVFDLIGHYHLADAHNTVSLGCDRAGHLHIAYAHHSSPLRYRRATRPLAIDAWTGELAMSGAHESRVTYPGFIAPGAGNPLLFLYRNGFWNSGMARLKQYDEKTQSWTEREPAPLDGTRQSPPANAYWNHPAVGPDGSLHLSFVWRSGSNEPQQRLGNSNMGYMVSRDGGHHWQLANGQPCALPVTPASAATVYAVPPGANLMNQCGMALDSRGRPHIVFYSNDAKGVPQYRHLRFDGQAWQCAALSRRTAPFVLSGLGTLQVAISRPDIVIDREDRVYVIYRADTTGQRMAAQRLLPPHYEPAPDGVRVLWDEALGYCEPVIDRQRWLESGVLSMLLQHAGQPDHDAVGPAACAPLQIVDWDLAGLWQHTDAAHRRTGTRWQVPMHSAMELRDCLAYTRPAPWLATLRAATMPRTGARLDMADVGQLPVDIVVCVHNARAEVASCLRALCTAIRPRDRLILMDDASDAGCAQDLRAYASGRPMVTVQRNEAPARGYCVTANRGIAAGTARWVLLLNSDTELCRGALEKMLRLGESSPRVAIVGPMSNAAQFQSLPEIESAGGQTAINLLPAGVSTQEMDAWCASCARGLGAPSVPMVHGFCMLVRRSLFERLGVFDEQTFPRGYGEEYDLCFRAVDAGFELKVATDAFVYHVKSASYNDARARRRLMRESVAALVAKHSPERFVQAMETMRNTPELVYMREQARLLVESRAQGPG